MIFLYSIHGNLLGFILYFARKRKAGRDRIGRSESQWDSLYAPPAKRQRTEFEVKLEHEFKYVRINVNVFCDASFLCYGFDCIYRRYLFPMFS